MPRSKDVHRDHKDTLAGAFRFHSIAERRASEYTRLPLQLRLSCAAHLHGLQGDQGETSDLV
jgi:hypothetical protein